MKRIIALVSLTVICVSVWAADGTRTGMGAEFARLSDEFIDGFLAWRPQQGTTLGLHQYDGRVTDLSRASLDQEHARLVKYAKAFAAIDHAALEPEARHRCRLIEATIQDELFGFDSMRNYTTNPMTYAGAVDVNTYIKRDFAPLGERVRSIIAVEKEIPAVVAAARANLEESLPKPYLELAIEIANGGADFLAKDLVAALHGLADPALRAEFKTANDRGIAELRGYAEWLTKDRLPKAHTHYALGREKYQEMLRTGELIDLAPEKILELGLRELKREQAVFADAARRIDPSKPAIQVFKEIQRDHPTEASLIPDVRKHLEMIRRFVVEHGIVTIPSDVRARTEETPQFARAGTFASMDSPGPFETKATEAYYYVTPTEREWTPQQKEEWLTSFNYYTTDVVTIHEAYPGHYVQFLNLNASAAGRAEKIFGSYAFVEGWAHYCEQMLLDEGFGAEGGAVRAAKYRIAQSDEALLRICRLCVSLKTHCEGMSVDEGAKFFEENCYYEAKPAHAEALRGTFDPGYLYYTLGKLQILKLRRDWQAQEGAAYSLKRFNDEMLRHGMPPIRLLREKMLKDPAQWGDVL
ncbi:MAG: hypothetical protein JWM88_380 [Verrucomicrobia bacterium]|nr:hypothetical protein [Verrucomicrobiota bacterium]